jgi:S-adenosylhomocysteine hydrolase
MMMESCWLLEYDSGAKFILSEEHYKNMTSKNNLVCEAHYFDKEICIKKIQRQ